MDSVTFPERIIGRDALAERADASARHGLGARILTVGDTTTLALAEHDHPFSIGAAPRPLLAHAEAVAEQAGQLQATGLIAFGSGTVNDVTKLAAHRLNLPYLCVATAASMNGYSSANASLIVDGHKQSLPARAPCAVIADLDILCTAPRRLARAGLGDTLCRSVVMADSYLSHRVQGTDFPRHWFNRLAAHEPWLLTNAALLREGAADYMEKLMHTLLDAGDAMHATGSSAVASQSEHMIAHTLELLYGSELHNVLHGEMIAITTTSMALLQNKMLLGQPQLSSIPRDLVPFQRQFGQAHGPALHATYTTKVLDEGQLAALDWPTIWRDMQENLPSLIAPAQSIERAYIEAGLATRPAGIGVLDDRYAAATSYAYLTRDRFTFLDLAAMNARRVA